MARGLPRGLQRVLALMVGVTCLVLVARSLQQHRLQPLPPTSTAAEVAAAPAPAPAAVAAVSQTSPSPTTSLRPTSAAGPPKVPGKDITPGSRRREARPPPIAQIRLGPPAVDVSAELISTDTLCGTGPRRSWREHPPEDQTSWDGEGDAMSQHAFNVKVSNEQPSDRAVPDTRNPRCSEIAYDSANLPTTSVIICFHNEARSTLLRTVRSVINRSPPHLLADIILVDDASDWPVPQDLACMEKVVVLRTAKREGLIRARVLGARHAHGEVLTFLDSHCEANVQWLEPLLSRIAENYTNVVTPVIDLINDSTFRYKASPLVRGGFNWGLTFKWKPIPGTLLLNDPRHPILSPTMAGGLFSIHRNWFDQLGTYDMGMDVWGGENLEISFRIWQCGGRLEIMQCSRVGHVFRKRHPYSFPGTSLGHIFLKNSMRAAEVWMDEYKEHFYQSRGSASRPNIDIGDISSRQQLRRELQCKPFSWYLANIYPELRVPNNDVLASGEMRTKGNVCIDSLGQKSGSALGLYACHGLGGNQEWTLTKGHELRHKKLCVAAPPSRAGREAILQECDEEEMRESHVWELTRFHQLRNPRSGLCLDASADNGSGSFVMLQQCDAEKPRQQWAFSQYASASVLQADAEQRKLRLQQ